MIIITAASFLLLKAVKTSPAALDKTTAAALAEAKEALIGYASTYRDDGHPNEVFGYLPMPDLGTSRNNGPLGEGNAAANFTGNTKNMTVIGRLPWRKLGIPALRDSQGECLWYAVSGSFQNASKANVLNWDSLGHFEVYSSNGTPAGTVSTTGTNSSQRPVAIVFSAGVALPGQNRQASTTDTVTECSGNYDARNYLDSFSADASINNIVNYFAGTANNATGYAYSLTNSADGSQLSAVALASPKKIISGDITTSVGKIVNDKILVITADDIFKRIKLRSDFAIDVNDLLSSTPISPGSTITLTSYLNSQAPLSLPTRTPGTTGSDDVYNMCKSIPYKTNCWDKLTPRQQNFLTNWHDNLFYTNLASPTQITIDGVLTVNPCNAVLIFGGERTVRTVAPLVAQTRAVSTEKSDATMYLEGGNATSFPNGTAYSGNSFYNAATPAADIAVCISP